VRSADVTDELPKHEGDGTGLGLGQKLLDHPDLVVALAKLTDRTDTDV
jgi:hypothetical protein